MVVVAAATRLPAAGRYAVGNHAGSFGFRNVQTTAEPGVAVAGVAAVVGMEAAAVAAPWTESVAAVGNLSR